MNILIGTKVIVYIDLLIAYGSVNRLDLPGLHDFLLPKPTMDISLGHIMITRCKVDNGSLVLRNFVII